MPSGIKNLLAFTHARGSTGKYGTNAAKAPWSWNGPRRHLTSSQKVMTYAMVFPAENQGKRTDLDLS